MSELDQTGQGEATDSAGATDVSLNGAGEQSAANSQTTSNGSGDVAEESFFDPKDIMGTPLEAAYKQMQGAFTKRMQGFSGNQEKLDAYDNFMSNPAGTLQQLAQQYGYQLVQPGQTGEDSDWSPQTWDEVMEKAEQAVMQKIQPLIGEVQNMKQSNMETYLDNTHSDWRTYEDDMVKILKDHPTLSKNPDLLYDMAVPQNVKEARAHKSALAKIQGQTDASAISGSSETTKKPNQNPKGIRSLDEAVNFAKQQLKSRGLAAPREY